MSALTPALIGLLDREVVGVLATESAGGRPRQSLVYYAREGDRLLISTEGGRYKAKDVVRTEWASLAVRGDERPFPSATFTGPARILTSGLGGPTAAIMQRITGADEPPPEQTDEALAAVDRVVLEIRVERVTAANYLDAA